MTPEELLKPRYKVIADYPMSYLGIGQVFTVDEANMATVIQGRFWEVDPSKFPALFKKLEWWEDRKIGDMPKYLRSQSKPINHQSRFSNCLIECGKDEFWSNAKFSTDSEGFVTAYGGIVIDCFTPATKEEYEVQQNSHNV